MAAHAKETSCFDDEHNQRELSGLPGDNDGASNVSSYSGGSLTLHKILRKGQIEETGVEPILRHQQTSTRFYNIFTIWFSMSTNILAPTFGMLGPLVFGLSLRDSSLIILFFNLLCCPAPAYLSTFGPKLGMRQMILARYSFGRYLASIPVLLNLSTMTGFCILICVVGGQCLSAVSDGNLSIKAGIVIIALLSLVVSFAGFKILHVFETYMYIPSLIALIIAIGCGGSDLTKQVVPETTPANGMYLSFGMIIAGYIIPWSALASDLSTYFDPRVPSWRVFAYTYWGLAAPTIAFMTLGAAMAGALPANPAWQDAYGKFDVGGIFAGMLSSAGGFGKFVLVLLSLTLLGNTSGTFYAITLNFQALAPWFHKIPRYLFAIVVTALVIPIAIEAVASDFLHNLNTFVSFVGYWSSLFVPIIVTEHLVFRRRYDSYDVDAWKDAKRLPWGVAAVGSAVSVMGLIVPCMDTEKFTGPIAKKTGDIGFEMAFVVTPILYIPLRYAERRLCGR